MDKFFPWLLNPNRLEVSGYIPFGVLNRRGAVCKVDVSWSEIEPWALLEVYVNGQQLDQLVLDLGTLKPLPRSAPREAVSAFESALERKVRLRMADWFASYRLPDERPVSIPLVKRLGRVVLDWIGEDR